MIKAIEGLQIAQRANLSHLRALKPDGALGRAIKAGTAMAHQAAVRKTHVETGSLRASHRVDMSGLRGEVYIDPNAINPRSGEYVKDYAWLEHQRGGEHAFYQRVQDEEGARIRNAVVNEFLRGMPPL